MVRRLLVLTLVAALTSMNVQSAELHVHATVNHVDDEHHHGPASHHHDAVEHRAVDAGQVAAVSADQTVVHVALVGASPRSAAKVHADYEAAPILAPGRRSIAGAARIVARSHGPPPTVQHSLRAPPVFLSL